MRMGQELEIKVKSGLEIIFIEDRQRPEMEIFYRLRSRSESSKKKIIILFSLWHLVVKMALYYFLYKFSKFKVNIKIFKVNIKLL